MTDNGHNDGLTLTQVSRLSPTGFRNGLLFLVRARFTVFIERP